MKKCAQGHEMADMDDKGHACGGDQKQAVEPTERLRHGRATKNVRDRPQDVQDGGKRLRVAETALACQDATKLEL
jgi:hypothetical protein